MSFKYYFCGCSLGYILPCMTVTSVTLSVQFNWVELYNWLQNYLPDAIPVEGIWISITFNCVFRTPTLHRVESKMFSCYFYSSSVVSAKLNAAGQRDHHYYSDHLSFEKRFILQVNLGIFSSFFMVAHSLFLTSNLFADRGVWG